MKKILIVLISVMFSGSMLFGQNTEFDSRLLVKYSVEELNKIEKENPSEIRFLTYCLNNAFYISEFPTGKEGSKQLQKINGIKDLNKINFFSLEIELKDQLQYFLLENEGKLLVVEAKNVLRHKFKSEK